MIVLEYWYIANDVFKLGRIQLWINKFSKSLKEFCNSNWTQHSETVDKGVYNFIPRIFESDACFGGNKF
ncbi:CEL_1a_G0014700.mRNA.1.CDS.1 [Saccharomyces cerevisiae]|nr:CEL_1a_G0014700.mRNA.1.CDS.1 [Saccharomyces cerevisiae]CAI7256440.1 CEL_1a_G0014700.mRNA.1.CDS.1 [Saccharomyces cerevisiae]